MHLSFHNGQSKDFCFLFVIVQLLVSAICYGQKENPVTSKQTLPFLHDSARIDYLNHLSYYYITVGKKDSAEYFYVLAYAEAKKINYIHGMAEAISLKATVTFTKYNNYPAAENLAREAILLYAKTPNKEKLNRTYYELGLALFVQSYFEGAINNFEISYDLSKKAHDSVYVYYSVTHSAYVYLESGNYLKAFEKGLEMHRLVLKNNNTDWKYWELSLISSLYSSIEDYNTALMYARQLLQINKSDHLDFISMAELFSRNQQFDSAKYYYSLVADTSTDKRLERFYLVSKGEYYFLQGQYKKALPNFLRALSYHKQVNDRNQVMRTLINLAKTYDSVRHYTAAFRYANEALAIAQQTGARQFLRDSYQILYSVYNHWQQKDRALFYHTRYVAIKDSITSAQVTAKLVAYNFSQKIEILNKEKELQQVRLQKESLVTKVLISGIVFLLLFGVVILRNMALKRRNEKQQLEHQITLQKIESERIKAAFQQRTTELQMQALRAQMNPHFIFNSLNSINHFILRNNTTQASGYLIKFSQLVRLILQNSQRSLISLESELEALNLYLDLEALRFDNYFDYTITIEEDLDISAMQVPPLIIQPYAENAIWHGLMNKKEKGHLRIEVFQQENMLCCRIIDDGIGRKKAAEMKSKSTSTYKSMGIGITADRIAMLHQINQLDTYITITDLVSADGSAGGTAITLKLPVRYD